MKTIFLISLSQFINVLCFSQSDFDDYCNWSYTQTASNAVIAIQQINGINYNLIGENGTFLNLNEINCPMYIGVFFTNNLNELVCAGYTEWSNSENMAISAWGDDATTPDIQDGFFVNDPYVFQLCIDGLGVFSQYSLIMSTENGFSDSYINNGFGYINSISFELPAGVNLAEVCELPLSVLEYNSDKNLHKTIDLYGRQIFNHKKGFNFYLYTDGRTSKFYKF